MAVISCFASHVFPLIPPRVLSYPLSGLEFPWGPKPFAEVVGGPLLRNNRQTADSSSLEGHYVGVYFSAHWVSAERGERGQRRLRISFSRPPKSVKTPRYQREERADQSRKGRSTIGQRRWKVEAPPPCAGLLTFTALNYFCQPLLLVQPHPRHIKRLCLLCWTCRCLAVVTLCRSAKSLTDCC